MIRFKVDEYVVREKGKEYSILVFPFVKYMWVYDDRPEEYCYMVDGTVESFSMLKYALAILTETSDKIIYFPCKQEGIGNCYTENYNLILCTPKAQFRRSSWIAIRRKLSPATKKGSYVLQYDRKKLDDYCTKKIISWENNGAKIDYVMDSAVGKKINREHLEELIGENLFMVLGKEECYFNHYRIANDLDEYCAGDEYGEWTAMGWIITKAGLERMKNRVKQCNNAKEGEVI